MRRTPHPLYMAITTASGIIANTFRNTMIWTIGNSSVCAFTTPFRAENKISPISIKKMPRRPSGSIGAATLTMTVLLRISRFGKFSRSPPHPM